MYYGVYDDLVFLYVEVGYEENGIVYVVIEKVNEYFVKGFFVNLVVVMYVIGNF